MENGQEWIKQDGAGLWTPKKIDSELIGVVMAVTNGTYGRQWVIQTKENDEIKTPSHKVLQSRMDKIKEGDVIKIVYKGDEPSKIRGYNPTPIYEVFKKKIIEPSD